MTYGRLLWANMGRNKKRTGLTIASVAVAFFLFATLRSILTTLDASTKVGSEGRLISTSSTGFTFPLPMAHLNRLSAVEGVKSVTWANWFGGIYIDQKNFFANMAIDSKTYLPMYPEVKIVDGDLATFQNDRTGALVGVKLMERFGWKVGQKVTLAGTIFPGDWDFTIRGVYKADNPSFDNGQFFFNYEYLYERGGPQVSPGWYIMELDRPDAAADIALRIDTELKNSSAPTKTATERAFAASFVTMWGNISGLVGAIGTAVFFAILFVAANTMMMAVRERVGEIAILKTLGFQNNVLSRMVIFESLTITLLGGFIGLIGAWGCFTLYTDIGTYFPGFGVTGGTISFGFALAFLLGLICGAIPAWQSSQLSVVNAIRRVA